METKIEKVIHTAALATRRATWGMKKKHREAAQMACLVVAEELLKAIYGEDEFNAAVKRENERMESEIEKLKETLLNVEETAKSVGNALISMSDDDVDDDAVRIEVNADDIENIQDEIVTILRDIADKAARGEIKTIKLDKIGKEDQA